MLRVEFTEQEATTLADVLKSTLSELVTETAATDNRELRAALKERKAVIRGILARLDSGAERKSA